MHLPFVRFLEFVENGKVPGATAERQRPLLWRSLMRRVSRSTVSNRSGIHRLAFWLTAALVAPGCGHEAKVEFSTVTKPPTVQVINPPVRTIVRVVGQPSFIEAYERTSVFPKLTAYIEKWNVDIGDRVKKGQTLATLFVPELVEDHGTKYATVELDKQRIELARKVVTVAEADVKSATAGLAEARAMLDKFEAMVERWDSEVKRLQNEVNRGVVDPQILLESTNQLKSSTAAREAAKATISRAEADLLSREATLAKAKVDVSVAQAALSVAVSEEKRIAAWVGYLKLPAPFDGVIVARNANTFDFVLPATGDPTAMDKAPAPVARRCRPDLRGRPHRHRPHFRRHPRAGRQLRPHRDQGDRARQGISRPANRGQRHPHFVGAERPEPNTAGRDRSAQPQ